MACDTLMIEGVGTSKANPCTTAPTLRGRATSRALTALRHARSARAPHLTVSPKPSASLLRT